MKKVLIITYYWPPSGGGGVMRWLKMSNYLPEFGWQPVIYTPENPDSTVEDPSLINEIHGRPEVLKNKIWEPYNIYRFFTGKSKDQKFKAGYVAEASQTGSIRDQISVFIRGNFLIPDPKVFWIRPSIKFLSNYLENNSIDLIITTGPPHSMHLIGLGLKNRFRNITWFADFRDPWTHIDFYDKLKLGRRANQKHLRLEKKVVNEADAVVTVSENWAHQFKIDHGRSVEVITNGFAEEDFYLPKSKLDDSFTITHIGSFNQDRNPTVFWKALKELADELVEFKENLIIRLVGQTDEKVIESIKSNGLSDNLEVISFVEHKESIQLITQSQVLLLPLNNTVNAKGIIPGKAFEYIAAKRPILTIGPEDGDAAKIINDLKSGDVCSFEDFIGLKKVVKDYFSKFLSGTLLVEGSDFEKYSRKRLAKDFIKLYNKIIEERDEKIR